jgi:ABC-type phosphate transport system ATPase subunit
MAVQTCDQAITFRNFNYARALEVVQDEQYLDDIDFDEIRLRRKQGEVFQAIDNFNEKIKDNFIQTDDFPEDSDIFHREKRVILLKKKCNLILPGFLSRFH